MKLKVSLVFLLVISFFIAVYPIYTKKQFEDSNTNVELVYTYESVKKLYFLSGIPVPDIIEGLKKAGLTSIILKEESVGKLVNSGKATYIRGSEIINFNRVFKSRNLLFSRIPRNYQIQPEFSYLIIDENNLFGFVKQNLQIKLGEDRINDLGWNILEVIDLESNILDLPLDVNYDFVDQIKKQGLDFIPMYRNSRFFSDEQVAYKLAQLKNKEVNFILFDEEDVLGYPNHLNVVDLKLRNLSMMFGFYEFHRQKGISSLAYKSPKHVLKVHYLKIKTDNPIKYTRRAIRAVSERNNRVIQVDPFTSEAVQDLYNYNLDIIKQLKVRIEQKGFTVAPIVANPYKDFAPSKFMYVAYVGAFALFMLVVLVFRRLSSLEVFISVVGYSFVVGVLFMYKMALLNSIIALGIAVCMPILIFVNFDKLVVPQPRKVGVINFIKMLVLVFAGSLCAGILINNLLYDTNYFWAISKFRGVKIANLIPFIIVAIYYFIRPERVKYFYYVIKRYLAQHLTLKYLAIMFLLMIFFVIYILRTGNYGFLVGNFEIYFRELLEEKLIVRPRTKELLFGYPLLVLTIYVWSKQLFPEVVRKSMVVFSTITSISMINTFCHIHTPVLVSFYRSALGVSLGTIVGLFGLVFLILGQRLYHRFFQKQSSD